MVKPAYPPEAKAKGIEGVVKIEALVNQNGQVVAAKATSGSEAVRPTALEAVRQWR